MKRTLAISTIIALILAAGVAYLYKRHIRKQEDAVAAFALSEIDKEQSACLKKPFNASEGCMQTTEELRQYMKTHSEAETMIASMDCRAANGQREFARLDACEQTHQSAIREWATKYPRQAAQRQADLLEAERKQDEKNMKRQP